MREKNSKIYIAGHRGLVGSAIKRKLEGQGYTNIIVKTHEELDLKDQKATEEFFQKEKPEYVFLAAAKVGGIIANDTYRAEFIYDNLQIQNNIIHQSYLNNVKKLVFLGSSCIYPKNSPQPIKEEYLLTDFLEYTNEPYAIAKIAGIKMCEAYNIQYGTNFIAVMPTNLYGPNDNYDLEKSHVLPALIRKMHLGKALENNDWQTIKKDLNKRPVEGISGNHSQEEILNILAKYGIKYKNGKSSIVLWGTGKPRREFLHSDDLAGACVYIMEKVDFQDLVKDLEETRNTHLNIGTGEDISIYDLAHLVKEVIGFKGEINWDPSKPDGTYRKLLDVSKLKNMGWEYKVGVKKGLELVYKEYV